MRFKRVHDKWSPSVSADMEKKSTPFSLTINLHVSPTCQLSLPHTSSPSVPVPRAPLLAHRLATADDSHPPLHPSPAAPPSRLSSSDEHYIRNRGGRSNTQPATSRARAARRRCAIVRIGGTQRNAAASSALVHAGVCDGGGLVQEAEAVCSPQEHNHHVGRLRHY